MAKTIRLIRTRKSRYLVRRMEKLGYPKSHIYKLTAAECRAILKERRRYFRTRNVEKVKP